MSLLLNEEFTLYRLRLGYINQSNDGVGERLININTAVLNEPAFRAAGWLPDHAALKRCYSPPIPTTGAAEYFSPPRRAQREGVELTESAEDGQGGLISGQRGSEDTLGPSALTEKERRRRKHGNKMEEDDSSELSDDSDEEDTAAQGVQFSKMPTRKRSETSPIRQGTLRKDAEGPQVKVISPSYRPRTSSLGATGLINAANATAPLAGRPRRDTTTSSEMSSDNEALEPNSAFRKKIPSRPQKAPLLSEKIAEEDQEDSELEEEDEEEDVEVAEASDLSDEFEGDDVAVPSPELLPIGADDASEEIKQPPSMPPVVTPSQSSPKKAGLPRLPKLPPGRSLSALPPPSLITLALKGESGIDIPEKPYQKYAELSGKGEAQPLWIKIYAPFSKAPDEPLQVPLRRYTDAEGSVANVNDLIGLALFRYDEEEYEPAMTGKDGKIESWELRMVEDGEIDMDFPALGRRRPVTDFTSNNNRPPQRRMRDKPWDEFGLVRAEAAAVPAVEETAPVTRPAELPKPPPMPMAIQTTPDSPSQTPAPASMIPSRNPITGPTFALANPLRKDSTNLLDAPQTSTATSTPRTGPATTVSVHFTDPQSFQTQLLNLPTTADTYIAELFDLACVRLRLDKALYVFKVRGTQTVAPSDRTVEALGSNLHLDLLRRRFGGVGDFGLGLSGSPGSTSPNAPLELVPNTPPTAKEAKRRKGFGVGGGILHPLVAQQRSEVNSNATSMLDLNASGAPVGRRYNVLRKQPLSFSASHPRTLVITPEYMQILPSTNPDDPTGGTVGGKVTNVPMSSIVGVKVSRKHPKMMRVLVYREKETKRYDFECSSHAEAEAIVGDIRVGLSEYGMGDE